MDSDSDSDSDSDFNSDWTSVKRRSLRVKKISQETYDGPDLISNLHEFILSHILSFLPTKDAVRTCVLSRRWTYVWTYITKLSFDDKNLYSCSSSKKKIIKSSFVISIYRVLLLLNSMRIHSFRLSVSQNYDPYHINLWIYALLIRKVKKIKLLFNSRKSGCNVSSNGLFKFHSLELLHLKFCDIQIPNSVSLSSLTVMKLDRIKIKNVGNPSNKLTLNLPFLKVYKQHDCEWLGVNTVSFEVPLLEALSITDFLCWNPRHQRQRHDMSEMVFSAVSLRRLFYSCYGLTQYIDLLADHVATAEIILNRDGVQRKKNFVCKLLPTNVQRLSLCMDNPKDFAEREYPSVGIPSFGMLVHLELNKFSTKLLLDLLLKAPCLQTLILKRLCSIEEPFNFATVPDCFLYTLKVVKFEMFLCDEELNIAKFLVENAKVLERISFSYKRCFSNKEMVEEVKEKLFSFKRSSLALVEFQCVS